MKHKTAKKWLSALLCTLMLLTSLPLTVLSADVNLNGTDFSLKLMGPDMQAFQGSETLGWEGSVSLPQYANVVNTYLAKNEREAYQIFYYEKREEGRDIRLVVDDYVNANGDVLPHEIFREEYFTVKDVDSKYFAEALVPYDGAEVHMDRAKNTVFFVELHSSPEQPAGVYTSRFTLYSGDEVVQTHEVTATVWNFALPEAHYGTTVMGLYNSASGYRTTQGFLAASGIRFANGDIIPEDRAEAERIIEGWQEFLLQHGVTTYELPRFLMETDEKAAHLAMADTRRKAVMIPSYTSGNALTTNGRALVQQYKDLMYDNDYLADKAFFYLADEPSWNNDADVAAYEALHDNVEAVWPGFHSVTPIAGNDSFPYMKDKLKSLTDIFCPNQAAIVSKVDGVDKTPLNQMVYDDFTSGDWFRTWRYFPMSYTGCIAVTRWGKTPMGVHAKVLYWQQEALHSDGILNWNCGFLPYVNGQPYDVWGTKSIFPRIWPANTNGESIFVYESKSLGLDPATPIASLRLKHINNGMDDYDYLQLAKEAFGTGPDSPYTQAMNKVFPYYTSKGPKYIFSCESSIWPDGGNYEWTGHAAGNFTQARVILGNALSEASNSEGFDHTYGDWNYVVAPDETHNGLKVRECTRCGALQSEKTYLCDDGSHDYSVYEQLDDENHTLSCSVCGNQIIEPHTPFVVEEVPATCTSDGREAGTVCAFCGLVLSGCGVIPGGHRLGDWIGEESANCTYTGVKGHYTCSVCQKDFDADGNEIEDLTLPVDANRHAGEPAVINAVAPTCTQPGYTGDSECPLCHTVVTYGREIAANGHSWNGGVVTAEPTCTKKGVKTFTCTVEGCGATKTEDVKALGHVDENKDGQCDRCDAEMPQADKCPLCGETHTGFFGKLVGFFHRIIYFFRTLFKR